MSLAPCFGDAPLSSDAGRGNAVPAARRTTTFRAGEAPGTCGDGTCDADEDNCTCPLDCSGDCPTGLPDLIYNADAANPLVIQKTFSSNDCAVQEACVVAGDRKLLRFTAEVRNIGTADLVLGNPVENPLFVYNPCFDHYQFEQFGQWRLVDANGSVTAGRKSYFCLSDDFRHDANANPLPVYHCQNQGLQAGWGDVYAAGLACQWIDVTDVPPGEYTLELEVNFERLLPESDYSNNVASVPVVIPAGEGERLCGDAYLALLFGSGLWAGYRLMPLSFGAFRPFGRRRKRSGYDARNPHPTS